MAVAMAYLELRASSQKCSGKRENGGQTHPLSAPERTSRDGGETTFQVKMNKIPLVCVFPTASQGRGSRGEGHWLCSEPAFVLKASNNNWGLFLSITMTLVLL